LTIDERQSRQAAAMDANDGLNSSAVSPDFQSAGGHEACDPELRDEVRSQSSEPVVSASAAPTVEPAAPGGAEKPQPKDPLPRLALIPLVGSKRERSRSETKATKPRWFDIFSVAASLILIALVSLGAFYDHSRQAALLAASAQETENFASTLGALKVRLDAIEGSRGREDGGELRKALGEIKAQVTTTREFSAALAQLTARVDRVERDQSARLDKLSEHVERDLPSRFTDIVARLDKLEKKSAPSVIGPVAPSSVKQAMLPTRGDLSDPSETTGSIEKPRPYLKGYSIADVRDGYAVIESRYGTLSVAPGDFIPGAGRVFRIERHGRAWAVVTSAGVIASDPLSY
jgi:hypothetical protein